MTRRSKNHGLRLRPSRSAPGSSRTIVRLVKYRGSQSWGDLFNFRSAILHHESHPHAALRPVRKVKHVGGQSIFWVSAGAWGERKLSGAQPPISHFYKLLWLVEPDTHFEIHRLAQLGN